MKCQVPGCSGRIVSKGLCDKHRLRLQHHGHLDSTRPKDWGKRSKHPLIGTYRWIKQRNTKAGVVPEWNDFWAFVKDVGARPSEGHSIRRYHKDKPYGPDNFYWKERLESKSKAEYAKKWRDANPLAAKSIDLKKMYGIDLDEYLVMLDAQGGVCAICGEKEKDSRFEYLSVDHCHTTGKVRGLLCNACNRAIGGLKDNPELLRKALLYLT